MTHLSEEQLIAYYYREAQNRAAAEAHLHSCADCRASLATLEAVLAAVDAAPLPERDELYGGRVWQRIQPRLVARPAARWLWWLEPRRFVAVAALAALLLAAFLAGRYWPRPQPPMVAGPSPSQVRERVLLAAVGDHLDRAQILLVALVNAEGSPAGAGGNKTGLVDISSEPERARDLVASNRLYRQTAAESGDTSLEEVLDALEPILVEIAHSPDQLSSPEFQQVRRRIESAGILFKVRVIDSRVRQKERATVPQPGAGKS